MAFAPLIGLALSGIGTVAGIVGQQQEGKALASADAAKQQQVNLDALRRNRDAVRQGVVARAQATFAASSQGASGGSGLQGGLGQVSGDVDRTVLATNQNQQLSSNVFAANQAYYQASGIAGLGVGLSSLGGAIMSNAGSINQAGDQLGMKGRAGFV